jgi:hypothetical protein
MMLRAGVQTSQPQDQKPSGEGRTLAGGTRY